MPKDTEMTIPAGVWVEITLDDVAAITAQNLSSDQLMRLRVTIDDTKPADGFLGLAYQPYKGPVNTPLDDLRRDGLGNRVFVQFPDSEGKVWVSHA